MKRSVVSLGFDGKYIHPYDLRVLADKVTIDLMKKLLKKKSIKITIASVAPKVEVFKKKAIGEVGITGTSNTMFVLEELNGYAKINHGSIKRLIEFGEDNALFKGGRCRRVLNKLLIFLGVESS